MAVSEAISDKRWRAGGRHADANWMITGARSGGRVLGVDHMSRRVTRKVMPEVRRRPTEHQWRAARRTNPLLLGGWNDSRFEKRSVDEAFRVRLTFHWNRFMDFDLATFTPGQMRMSLQQLFGGCHALCLQYGIACDLAFARNRAPRRL